jgi:hypothetical protein
MLRIAIALTAALGMAQVAGAQAPAGDQGAPGTSTNRNQQGTSQRGSGTQGTTTNNQSGRDTRNTQPGQAGNAGDRSGRTGQASAGTGRGGTANQGAQHRQTASHQLEAHAADCLILKNEEEIATLKFASSKIQDDSLKQAAQKMIDDHQQAISKLKRFAAHGGDTGSQASASGGDNASRQGAAVASTRTGDSSSNTTGASGTAIASRDAGRGQSREARRLGTDDQASANAAGGGSMHDAMYQVALREKEECLKLTQADLSKHEGAKFDKALVAQQSVVHTGMLAKLRALQNQSSSEFSQLLQELEATTQHHKQQLDQTMEQLSSKAESEKSRR